MPDRPAATLAAGVLCALASALAWSGDGWTEPVHTWLTAVFSFPGNPLVEVRKPGQLVLLLWHLRLWLPVATAWLLAGRRLPSTTRWLTGIVLVGYAVRAFVWGIGGNLPMVQADSAHHWSMAHAVAESGLPRLPYVASFFRPYPRWGMVDDWSMPLNAYWLAAWFLVLGKAVWVAKTATFVVNLLALPLSFGYARSACGTRVALLAAATLALFPPHVLVASWMLKESLAAFLTVAAAWTVLAALRSTSARWPRLALAAGAATGLMALSRRTLLAAAVAFALAFVFVGAGRRWVKLLLFGVAAAAVLAPWAYLTWADYGTPLYSYTGHFRYLPDWTVHWRDRGVPTAADWLADGCLPVLRTKFAVCVLLAVYFAMILTPPLLYGYALGLRRWRRPATAVSALVLLGFVGGTVTQIASTDQIRDLGRYFPPCMILMIPVAWQGLRLRLRSGRRCAVALAVVAGFFLTGYPWTDNTRLLSDPWHLRYARYERLAARIAAETPPDAVVMAYHPWEIHLLTGRRTVLLPRSYDPARVREEIATYRVTHLALDRADVGPLQTALPELQRLVRVVVE